MRTQIALIRHGETDWNMQHRWQGHAPIPLNDTGCAQAMEAAEQLQDAGFTRIVASDLLRCVQTAEILNRVLDIPVDYDSRLREIDVGWWQGLTGDEIKLWDAENYENYRNASYLTRAFPGGESFQQLIQRSTAALMDIQESCRGEHVLVVTHGGVIRAVLYHLFAFETGSYSIQNCSVNRLTCENGVWQWE